MMYFILFHERGSLIMSGNLNVAVPKYYFSHLQVCRKRNIVDAPLAKDRLSHVVELLRYSSNDFD